VFVTTIAGDGTKHDIDETVLPGLTHETLKELGVASIGHRADTRLERRVGLQSTYSGHHLQPCAHELLASPGYYHKAEVATALRGLSKWAFLKNLISVAFARTRVAIESG
jgi:hypothetical protein